MVSQIQYYGGFSNELEESASRECFKYLFHDCDIVFSNDLGLETGLLVLVGSGPHLPQRLQDFSDQLDKGRKGAVFGTTISIQDHFDPIVLANVYAKSVFVAVADLDSKQRFGADNERVIVMGDLAMICSRFRYDYQTVSPSRVVGAFYYPDVFSRAEYVLSKKRTVGLYLHQPWDGIVSFLKGHFDNVLVLSDYKYGPLLKEIKQCSVVLGQGLLPIVLATSLGIPTLALGESSRGYMKTIRMEEWIVNEEEDSVTHKLKQLLHRVEDITMSLDGVIGMYQTKLYQLSRYLVDSVLRQYPFDLVAFLNESVSWNLRSIIHDTYGGMHYDSLKQYIQDQKIRIGSFDLKKIAVLVADALPIGYVDARNYITSYYPTTPFVDGQGFGPSLQNLLSTQEPQPIDMVDLNNEEKLPLSSYVVYLPSGYCSQKFKLNGYSGYNMFLDGNKRMLRDFLWHFGPCCWTWHHNKWGHQHLYRFTQSDVTYFPGTVVCLLSNHNYGHFLHDIISSLALIEKENIGPHKLYLNSQDESEYIMTCLSYLGYSKKDIILAEFFPIIQAERLYLPVQQPRQVEWMKDWIRLKFRNIWIPPLLPPCKRRIYIGRNLDAHRRILNESELMTFLSGRGFEYIPTIRNLSFEETVRTFRECEMVIMSHGANCMNTHWCDEGTRVIYITNDKLRVYHGYFRESYTNRYIRFSEFIGKAIDFDRTAYVTKVGGITTKEEAWMHWKQNGASVDYPRMIAAQDDKWDMVVDVTQFQEFFDKLPVASIP